MTPLTNEDFQEAAEIIGGPWTRLKALNKVESNGKPGAKLFEPHIFYRELKKMGANSALEKAIGQKVAHPRWKGIPYRSSQFAKAVKINRKAAYMATSWGQFQIMGFNHQVCGYGNVDDFVRDMQTSTEAQLKAVCRFIMANKTMHKAYLERDWKTFARLYNGTLYYKNNYHNKLAHWAATYKAKDLDKEETIAAEPPAAPVAKEVTKGVGLIGILSMVINELSGAVTTLKQFSGSLEIAKYTAGVFGVIIFLLMIYQIYRKVKEA